MVISHNFVQSPVVCHSHFEEISHILPTLSVVWASTVAHPWQLLT